MVMAALITLVICGWCADESAIDVDVVSVLITVECDGDSGSSDNDAGGDDCDTFCCVKYVLVSCACEL